MGFHLIFKFLIVLRKLQILLVALQKLILSISNHLRAIKARVGFKLWLRHVEMAITIKWPFLLCEGVLHHWDLKTNLSTVIMCLHLVLWRLGISLIRCSKILSVDLSCMRGIKVHIVLKLFVQYSLFPLLLLLSPIKCRVTCHNGTCFRIVKWECDVTLGCIALLVGLLRWSWWLPFHWRLWHNRSWWLRSCRRSLNS